MDYDPTAVFRGTAWYYARFRPGYMPELFDHVVATYDLDGTTRVVDLGTGTGQIAFSLAKRGITVVAIDPDPEMLVEARAIAERERVRDRLRLLTGRGEDLLALVQPPVRLVTYGASFHWTDRDQALSLCGQLVDASGGVALLSGGSPTKSRSEPTGRSGGGKLSWSDVVSEVIEQFLGPRRRAGTAYYTHPEERHEQVLARSCFARVELWRGETKIVRTIDEVIGLQYSASYCSSALLGDPKGEFERVLRARLLAVEPRGRFLEIHKIEALCAKRG